MPPALRPMLASKGDRVPSGEGWAHEIKWDGVRALAEVTPTSLALWSRQGNNVAGGYPELSGLRDAVHGHSAILDGEIVCVKEGRPSFQALAHRMHVRDSRRLDRLVAQLPVTYMVFDLVRLDGIDLTRRPLSERRALLEALELMDDHWQTPPTYDDGDLLLAATEQQGLEGIVSKRLDSAYEPGARTPKWLKFPHRRRQSYVVGGWRPERDSETRLGSVLLGQPTPEGVYYRGKVGAGIAGKVPAMLKELLQPLARVSSGFVDDVPREDAARCHWVEPQIVVDVEALGLSEGGRLRQPAFIGVRHDLTPEDLWVADE